MISRPLRVSLLAMSLMTSACGSGVASKLDGHYEDADETEMEAFRGQQSVPAEYAKSNAVIVSSLLLSEFGREDLVKAILDAGASQVYITVSRDSGENLRSATFSQLRQVLGRDISKIKVVEQLDQGSITVWARDWAPLAALTNQNSLRLLDLNYYPRRPADDATGRSFAGISGVERVSVPVYNEGGNFMINGRGECLMTTRVTDANRDLYLRGDRVLDESEIRQYYAGFAGCRSTTIFPRMPTEGTGHIDMWAKFLNDDTVIVGQISDETLALATNKQRATARVVQAYLNERATQIADMGYKVRRMPMPVPGSGLYRSYTNSLLLNGTALVPQYGVTSGTSYADQSLLPGYEAAVRKVYESLGYRVVFIPSDELIANGGAVHCVTMQIPAAL